MEELNIDVSEISIHAPAKGATQIQTLWTGYKFHFNPRSREGSDWEPGSVGTDSV